MKLVLILLAIVIVSISLLFLIFIQDIRDGFKENPVGHFVRFKRYGATWLGEVRACTETQFYVRYRTPGKKSEYFWVNRESCKLVYFPPK